MASLGPEDYGMTDERPLRRRAVITCAVILAVAIGWAVIYSWLRPEEVSAALKLRYDQCDPSARFIDNWGRPNCDPEQDMKAKGKRRPL